MEWQSFKDKKNPGDWRVEAIDHDNEGVVYVAIFSGPNAQVRAEEYVYFKARDLAAMEEREACYGQGPDTLQPEGNT